MFQDSDHCQKLCSVVGLGSVGGQKPLGLPCPHHYTPIPCDPPTLRVLLGGTISESQYPSLVFKFKQDLFGLDGKLLLAILYLLFFGCLADEEESSQVTSMATPGKTPDWASVATTS